VRCGAVQLVNCTTAYPDARLEWQWRRLFISVRPFFIPFFLVGICWLRSWREGQRASCLHPGRLLETCVRSDGDGWEGIGGADLVWLLGLEARSVGIRGAFLVIGRVGSACRCRRGGSGLVRSWVGGWFRQQVIEGLFVKKVIFFCE
jgi:hypothetical protein